MFRSVNQIYELIIPTKNKELVDLYATLFLRTLAFSLVGIFVPLYMIKELGYSIGKTLFFFIIFDFSMALVTPLAAKLSRYLGIKNLLLLSFPFHIVYLIMLGLLKPFPMVYYFAPVLSGIANGFFWIAFHNEFSDNSDGQNKGKEVSLIFAIPLMIGIIGPLLGAFIATNLGFNLLYTIATTLLALSTLPLLFIKNKFPEQDVQLKRVFKNPVKDFVGFAAYGMRDYGSILLWPIYVFYILGTYLSIGIIGSGVALLNSIAALIIGRVSDHGHGKKMLKIASFIDSSTWVIRHLFKSIFSLFAVTSLSAVATLAMYIPFTSMTYDKVKSHNKLEYLIFREFGLFVGRVLIMLFAIFIPLEFTFFIIASSNFLLFFF